MTSHDAAGLCVRPSAIKLQNESVSVLYSVASGGQASSRQEADSSNIQGQSSHFLCQLQAYRYQWKHAVESVPCVYSLAIGTSRSLLARAFLLRTLCSQRAALDVVALPVIFALMTRIAALASRLVLSHCCLTQASVGLVARGNRLLSILF